MDGRTKGKIFYGCVGLLFAVLVFFAKLSRWSLEKDHTITTAVIDEVGIVGRERFVKVQYHYLVNDHQYNDNASFNQRQMSYDNFRYLVNKNVNVAYHIGRFSNASALLIFPENYEEFKLKFPDSLSWILPMMIGK